MFRSLKNKIKEETGSEFASNAISKAHSNRSRVSSTISLNLPTNEANNSLLAANNSVEDLQDENPLVEKGPLLAKRTETAEAKSVANGQQYDKMHNMKAEIVKLKNLLSFREQEAVDRIATLHQSQQKIENITTELIRLRQIEPIVEELRDELERLRHTSQLEKNNLTATLAAVTEENNHLKRRLQIFEQARLETMNSLITEEKIQILARERKLLEEHLEETHLQLSDIKSTWSAQNMTLETQLSRLSKQVAEEAAEKGKALKARDDLLETIKLLESKIYELNAALKDRRGEANQDRISEFKKVEVLESNINDLQTQLQSAAEHYRQYSLKSEQAALNMQQQLEQLQVRLTEAENRFEHEREEKLTALLHNAEISQSEEILRRELRVERKATLELRELNEELQNTAKSKESEIISCHERMRELQLNMVLEEEKVITMENIQQELDQKNKAIKMLNQRLVDIKKALLKEFCSITSFDAEALQRVKKMIESGFVPDSSQTIAVNSCCSFVRDMDVSSNVASNPSSGIIMDEVNFMYLKHVIVKFLTSREVEARHLVRAVAMLLKLNQEEEKLLHDTLSWKISWFGSKPDHSSGQRAFAVPRS